MVRLALSLLGPFEVTLNGAPVSWSGGDATRALLAYLALHAGTDLRREVLAGLLWPDVPQAAALANLRQALHRLRASIGDSEADLACLHVTRQMITCRPPAAEERPKGADPGSDPTFWLDVAAFRAALHAVAEHAHRPQERCASCMRRLEEATALYRGEFLAGFSYPSDLYEGWMVVEREALHAQALEALALLADGYAARGQHENAIRAARRQIELEPWREVAHRQCMRALTASGRRGAALAQYEACRRALQEELGIEPEPKTTALYERIRSGSEAPATSGATDKPEAPGFLPVPPTPLIGRQAQISQAIDLLAGGVRLLTLTGAGGTGKTRLALEIGARLRPDYPHGVYFVPLAPLRNPAYVVPAIARVLGVRETEGQPLIESLEYTVRDRRLLLILDNYEHLLPAASVVSQLLAAAPTLQVLVTSRAPLHLYGEHEYGVPPMEVPAPRALPSLDRLAQAEAVQLFVQRARAVRPGFALGEGNAEAVAETCARLDGLPLAIELAAARVKLLPPQAILSRLDERLHFLTGGPRDLPERQRTLRATIDWSYDLLDAAERTLFCRLSVFAGGCTLQAIEAVMLEPPSPGPALNLVGSLVDQSLLAVRAGDAAQAEGEPRFTMLETVRAYAAERLDESGEAPAVRRRHAAFFLDLAQEAEPILHRYGFEQAAWMDRLEREQDNLHAALDWALAGADVELGMRLALALGRFWEVGLWHDQGREWLTRALDASADRGTEDVIEWTPLHATALNWAGTLAMYSDPGAAVALQVESLALWQETGDVHGIGYTLCELGMAVQMLGDLDAAQARMQAGIAMLRRTQDTLSLARALYAYATIPLSQGDHERARALLQESAQLSRQIGALAHTATAIRMLGHIAQAEGDLEATRSAYEENLRRARQAKDRLAVEQCLSWLGQVAYALDDCAKAIGYWQEALDLYRSSGNKVMTAETLLALGIVARWQGDAQRTEQLTGEGLALARELPDARLLAKSLHEQGQSALAQENVCSSSTAYAARLFAKGLDISQENRLLYMIPAFLADLAAVEVDLVRAVRLFGAAQALLDAADDSYNRVDRVAYDRALAAARAALDEHTFARAWAEGREMAASSSEPAIDYALGRSEGPTD
jgi:predicted ATPase/DNA-binding SARP family transcriptional activator